MKFHTTVLTAGVNTTGVNVPEEIVLGLGGGKKPLVKVTIHGYTYRSAIAPRGDRYMLGISADVRAATGVAGGDEIDIELELDTEPREVAIPPELAKALAADPQARAVFDGLSYSKKTTYAAPIANGKTDETRKRNLQKAMKALQEK